MRGWSLESFSGIGSLKLRADLSTPIISTPHDVLVKVEASSVNPLDVMMTKGYGQNVLSHLRASDRCNGIILGRDFSGIVVDKGMSVSGFQVGDSVWGATFPSSQGSHSEFVSASSLTLTHKPDNLSHLQAASIPFTALTAWSALMVSAGLSSEKQNKNTKFKILVIGASGGVGTFAVQLLKALNYSVVAVSQEFELVASLGADVVLDYLQPDYEKDLQKLGSFDVVLDFAGLGEKSIKYMQYLRPWSNAKIVTLMSPLLKSTDANGLIPGSIQTITELAVKNVQSVVSHNGSTFRYGYFMPNPYAMKTIKMLVEKGKIRPIVQEEFKLENLPAAYERIDKGHLVGKIVVNHS